MKTTITEALADIKTSQARIQKKRVIIKTFLGRDSRIRDPMEGEGGSQEFIRRERQSIRDLETKIVRIRSAIQAANLATELEIEGEKKSLAEWLNWRRDVATGSKSFLSEMAQLLAHLASRSFPREGTSPTPGWGSGWSTSARRNSRAKSTGWNSSSGSWTGSCPC